jgi:uncharacterized protein
LINHDGLVEQRIILKTIFMINTTVNRVESTEAARDLIDQLRQKHGPLMFHQSGGCCDGSQPMCFEAGEFKTGESDVLMSEVYGCNFYMARDQYEYWKHTQLTLESVLKPIYGDNRVV